MYEVLSFLVVEYHKVIKNEMEESEPQVQPYENPNQTTNKEKIQSPENEGNYIL